MSEDDRSHPKTSRKSDEVRRERLAAELRANLKRRKAQARARAVAAPAGAPARSRNADRDDC